MNKIDNKEIILELALFLNKKLLTDNKINYQIYTQTENYILQKLKTN